MFVNAFLTSWQKAEMNLMFEDTFIIRYDTFLTSRQKADFTYG